MFDCLLVCFSNPHAICCTYEFHAADFCWVFCSVQKTFSVIPLLAFLASAAAEGPCDVLQAAGNPGVAADAIVLSARCTRSMTAHRTAQPKAVTECLLTLASCPQEDLRTKQSMTGSARNWTVSFQTVLTNCQMATTLAAATSSSMHQGTRLPLARTRLEYTGCGSTQAQVFG